MIGDLKLNPANLNVGAIKAFTRRYVKVFTAVFIALFAAAVMFTLMQQPLFEATALVKIQPSSRSAVPVSDAPVRLSAKEGSLIDTEVEVLHGLELARRTAAQVFSPAPKADQVDTVIDNIKINRFGKTSIISITFESDQASTAAKIANAYAKNYLTLQIEAKMQSTQSANKFLSQRIEEMAVLVEQAERRVQNFKIDNALMSVNGTTLAEQSIASIDNDLARAKAEEKASVGRLNAAYDSGARLGAAQTPALEDLLARQAAAEVRWKQVEQTYGALHPEYQAAKTKFARLNHAVAQETGRAESGVSATRQQDIDRLHAEASAASQKRASLARSARITKKALAGTNNAQVKLDALERKARAVRANYEAYLSRYQETSTRLGAEQADAIIISKATVPTKPSKPNWPVNLAFGGALAFLTALSVVTAISTFDSRLSTPAEVERLLDVQSLPSLPMLISVAADGEVGEMALAPEDYLVEYRKSVFARQYQNLYLEIFTRDETEGKKVIAVTSALPDEGKTITALCLARTAALNGSHVILVDCNIGNSSLHEFADSSETIAAEDDSRGGASLASNVQIDGEVGLDMLVVPSPPAETAALFNGKLFENLLAGLREEYDLIILDAPPVLGVSETRQVAALSDNILFLCKWRSTPLGAVEESLKILDESGSDITGIALSMVDWEKQMREGFGDPAYYVKS